MFGFGSRRTFVNAREKYGSAGKRVPLTGLLVGSRVIDRPHCHIAVEGGFRHLQRGTNVIQVDGFVLIELLGEDNLRLSRLHRRTPAFPAPSPCGCNAGFSSLLNELPLELGERGEDLKHEFTRRSRRGIKKNSDLASMIVISKKDLFNVMWEYRYKIRFSNRNG